MPVCGSSCCVGSFAGWKSLHLAIVSAFKVPEVPEFSGVLKVSNFGIFDASEILSFACQHQPLRRFSRIALRVRQLPAPGGEVLGACAFSTGSLGISAGSQCSGSFEVAKVSEVPESRKFRSSDVSGVWRFPKFQMVRREAASPPTPNPTLVGLFGKSCHSLQTCIWAMGDPLFRGDRPIYLCVVFWMSCVRIP